MDHTSCVSPSPSVPGTNIAQDNLLLEPIPSPSPSCVMRKTEIKGKPPSRYKYNSGVSKELAAAAPTPGMLKYAKEIDINHLHVSLAHAHMSISKATA